MGSCCGKAERSGAGQKSGTREKGGKGRKSRKRSGYDDDVIPPSRPLLSDQTPSSQNSLNDDPTTVQIDPPADAVRPGVTREVLPSGRILETLTLIPIKFAPADKWQQCAYCDDPAGDRYDYFYCREMPCKLLEDLTEHGWWRTGQVIFKPRFKEVCCPGYALRMSAAKFVPSKSQKRIVRRWRNFLMYGDPRWENRDKEEEARVGVDEVDSAHNVTEVRAAVNEAPELVQAAVASGTGGPSVECGEEENVEKKQQPEEVTVEPEQQPEEVTVEPEQQPEEVMVEPEQRPEEVAVEPEQRPEEVTVEPEQQPEEVTVEPKGKEDENEATRVVQKKRKKPVTPGRGPDPNKPPCKKAKERRMENRQQKLIARGSSNTTPPKSIPQPKKMTLQELFQEHFTDHPEEWRHQLEVKLLPCNPRDPQLSATLEQAYHIYDKFQQVVHPGKVRFSSPFEYEWGFMNSPLRNPPEGFMGTYHMHYYLDGELIMISILDILPQYFVSIYFIYDPDIRFMKPGIYTCLQELELVQRIQRQQPELIYYALGYYNHFDSKVSYKRQFGPQEVLCNETDVFVPLKDAIPKFYIKRYIRLVDDDSIPEKEGRTASIDNLIVATYLGPLPFKVMSRNPPPAYQKALREFISETGSASAHRFLIELV